MQVLRIVGAAADGRQLICAVTGDGPGPDRQTFLLPVDDALRTAVAGTKRRTGQWEFDQLEIDMASQLRPREIQDRIRAGATAAQVAAAAGCPVERIEPFAYPVLMERAAVAERAGAVKPFAGAALGSADADRADATLTAIVASTLADRGQGDSLTWDAFRDERGWTVTATWRTGRSENRAEWAFRPRADGGTVAARNETAADLVDPAPRGLRTIDSAATADGADQPGTPAGAPAEPTPLPLPLDAADTGTDGPVTATRPKSRRGQRPVMPSWEDVLLGGHASEQ